MKPIFLSQLPIQFVPENKVGNRKSGKMFINFRARIIFKEEKNILGKLTSFGGVLIDKL